LPLSSRSMASGGHFHVQGHARPSVLGAGAPAGGRPRAPLTRRRLPAGALALCRWALPCSSQTTTPEGLERFSWRARCGVEKPRYLRQEAGASSCRPSRSSRRIPRAPAGCLRPLTLRRPSRAVDRARGDRVALEVVGSGFGAARPPLRYGRARGVLGVRSRGAPGVDRVRCAAACSACWCGSQPGGVRVLSSFRRGSHKVRTT
jgi:hypothetical protein